MLDDIHRQSGALGVLAQPSDALAGNLDGSKLRSSGGELHRLPTRRRTKIGDALTGNVSDQLCRKRRGGVLHPPCTVSVAGEVSKPCPTGETDRPGW